MDSEQQEDMARLEKAVQELGEHFDSVLILVTRNFGSKRTVTANVESGNTFANYGAAKQYTVQHEDNMVRRKEKDWDTETNE